MATKYNLEFVEAARKEWNRLAPVIRVQFARKLMERLAAPRVPSAALHGMRDCYKIKLHDVGYRLVYQVRDETITVRVIAVGRRDRDVYDKAGIRQ